MRKIIHLDMDCFYAAVEMREHPELAGQPIAVGGGSRRGVVTTCNYEARKFGVHSAMPGFQARERCPHLVFLPVRFDLYRAESTKIRQILQSYTPLVEPLSLDEAYRQAREYMISLMHTCQKHKAFKRLIHGDGKHKGQFLFPFGYFSILSNATRSQIDESEKSVLFPKDKVMTRDEFLAWEELSPKDSLDRLKSYFDPWWPINPLTKDQVDALRAIIHPEVILFSFMDEKKAQAEETLKVLDVKQENHARNIGNGHRIVYGVAGSGKTVILVARAKLIASTNTQKQHLFLC